MTARTLGVTLAALGLLLAHMGHAFVPNGAVCYAPGVCISAPVTTGLVPSTVIVIDTTSPHTSPCSPDPPVLSGNINIYVIWYSNAGRPWTSAAKQQVIDFLSAIPSTQWFGGLESFTNTDNTGPTYATGLNVQNPCTTHCVVDPENEGTVMNANTGLGWCGTLGTDALIIRANVPTNLPADPAGMYLILPSNNDLTGTLPGAAWHVGSKTFCTGGSDNVPFMMLQNTGGGSNTGSQILGIGASLIGHELAEGISNNCNGYFSTGMASPCGGSSTAGEIADVCVGGCPIINIVGTGYQQIPSLGPAGGYFMTYVSASATFYTGLPAYLHNYQGGYCDVNPWPNILNVACNTSADCPTFSGICGTGLQGNNLLRVCQLPTCSDGIKNGAETDTDCGANCTGCAVGKSCILNIDCAGSNCTSFTCH